MTRDRLRRFGLGVTPNPASGASGVAGGFVRSPLGSMAMRTFAPMSGVGGGQAY